MDHLILPLTAFTASVQERLHRAWKTRGHEQGLGTLELVIITLGLIAVAGLLVAAITAAVQSRTNQIQ